MLFEVDLLAPARTESSLSLWRRGSRAGQTTQLDALGSPLERGSPTTPQLLLRRGIMRLECRCWLGDQ